MDILERLFGTPKPVIAMLHFPGLPGRPRFDKAGGLDRLVDSLGRDLAILQEARVDGVLFCNEADIPAMPPPITRTSLDMVISFGNSASR